VTASFNPNPMTNFGTTSVSSAMTIVAPSTASAVTIVVQRTSGISFNGQYNTVGGSITQSSTSKASTITYQFNLDVRDPGHPGRADASVRSPARPVRARTGESHGQSSAGPAGRVE
jgi:hypothetical protein